MPYPPPKIIMPEFESFGDTSTSYCASASVTSSASTHTKGAWQELVASTTYDYDALALICNISDWNTYNYRWFVDVGIGAASSEVVIAENIPVHNAESSDVKYCEPQMILPVPVKAGTRIAVRCQCSVGSRYVYFGLAGIRKGWTGPRGSKIIAIGADTANTYGTTITASGSTNTKGSYTELTSSTSKAIKGFFITFHGQNALTRATGFYLVDIAIGAASSEVDIVKNHPNAIRGEDSTSPRPYISQFFPIPIPAGTRLSARLQSNVASATLGVIIHALE